MNNKTKLLIVILFLSFIYSCSIFNNVEDQEKIRILEIDDNSLEFHYAIRALYKNEQIIIVSKKLNQDFDCNDRISKREDYFFTLKRKKQIEIDDNISFKANGEGLYINDKLFLKAGEKIFSSPSLNGLCLENN